VSYEDITEEIGLRTEILKVDKGLKEEFGTAFLNEELRKGNFTEKELEEIDYELERYSIMSIAFKKCKKRYYAIMGNKIAKNITEYKIKSGIYEKEIEERKERIKETLLEDEGYMATLKKNAREQEKKTKKIISDEELLNIIDKTALMNAREEILEDKIKMESELIFRNMDLPYIPRHLRSVLQRILTSGSKNLSIMRWALANIQGSITPKIERGLINKIMGKQDDNYE